MAIHQNGGDIVPFHGDHEPVSIAQGRKSRNLLPIMSWDAKTQGGMTYSNLKDGGFKVTGTATGYQANIWFVGNYNDWVVNNAQAAVASFEAGTKVTATDCNVFWVALDKDGNLSSRGSYGADIGLSQHSATKEVANGTTMYVIAVRDARVAPDMVMDTVLYPRYGATDEEIPYERPGTVTDPIYIPQESTKSGTELEFEPSYNHAAEVSVEGKSEQVQLSGKNLLDLIGRIDGVKSINRGAAWDGSSYTYNGITWSINGDGTVSVKGTASRISDLYFYDRSRDENLFVSNGTYTYSCEGTTSNAFAIISGGGGGNGFPYSELYSGATKTASVTNEDSAFNYVLLRVLSGSTVDSVLKPQLEAGSTATDYEPYCGGIPSPNPDYPQPIESVESVSVGSRGRNLWEHVGYKAPSDSKWSSFMIPAGKYYIKDHDGNAIPTPGNHNWYFALSKDRASIDMSPNVVRMDGMDISSSTGWNYGATNFDEIWFEILEPYYIKISRYQIPDTFRCTLSNMQLDEYEPYHASRRTIDLQGHELRSLPDGTRDEVRVYRDGRVELVKRVESGSFNDAAKYWWGDAGEFPLDGFTIYSGHENMSRFFPGIAKGIYSEKMCDKIFVSPSVRPSVNGWYLHTYSSGTFIVHVPTATGKADAISKLASIGATLFYKVEQPQAIQLPSIDPLDTFYPYTFVDADGLDLSASVLVVDIGANGGGKKFTYHDEGISYNGVTSAGGYRFKVHLLDGEYSEGYSDRYEYNPDGAKLKAGQFTIEGSDVVVALSFNDIGRAYMELEDTQPSFWVW